MDYLKTIVSTFENHEIYKYSELKYERFNKSIKHPSSEGIIFESLDFAGEIFYYKNMEYCEMEILIFKTENHKFKIIENLNLIELGKTITEFLNKSLIELKNVA
jgi:hypothetical protein